MVPAGGRNVLVTHDASNFCASLYRMKTFTGLYTYFSSLAPDKYKNNLISDLVYRAFHIYSSFQNFHNEIVRGDLGKNSFPRALIDCIIKSFLDKRLTPRPSAPQEAKTALLFCMPYLCRYSLQIKTKICRIIKQCYPSIQLNLIFRSPKRIQSFFHLKIAFQLSYSPQLFISFSVLAATPRTSEKHLVI